MDHMPIKHREGCPAERIESYPLEPGNGSRWRVSRCGDCGEQTNLQLRPATRPPDDVVLVPQLSPADIVGGNRWTANQPETEAEMRQPTSDDLTRRYGG